MVNIKEQIKQIIIMIINILKSGIISIIGLIQSMHILNIINSIMVGLIVAIFTIQTNTKITLHMEDIKEKAYIFGLIESEMVEMQYNNEILEKLGKTYTAKIIGYTIIVKKLRREMR